MIWLFQCLKKIIWTIHCSLLHICYTFGGNVSKLVINISLTVWQQSVVCWRVPCSCLGRGWSVGPENSVGPPVPPVCPTDCGHCLQSPEHREGETNTLDENRGGLTWTNTHTYTKTHPSPHTHKAYYYIPINCITVYSLFYLTPRSLTFSLASCPDRAASIRSASWFSFCSSTPCSSLLFLLPQSLSSLVHSWLSFPSVCWTSFTPRFPLDCSSRDFPSFSMSFTLLVRRTQVHYSDIYNKKKMCHTYSALKTYSPSNTFTMFCCLRQSPEHHVKSKEKFQNFQQCIKNEKQKWSE